MEKLRAKYITTVYLVFDLDLRSVNVRNATKNKISFMLITTFIMLITFCGCSKKSDEISVISREDGSGTRTSFGEIFNINKNGVDDTALSAQYQNSTSVVIMSVITDKNAIGYISAGAMNNEVKAVNIDGIEPNIQNIQSDKYKVTRPFILITQNSPGELTKDFLSFIYSFQGENIIRSCGYMPSFVPENEYTPKNIKGKITISGSSSMALLLERLYEEYEKLNTNSDFELQQTGSTAGIIGLTDNACEIAISSRELTEDELKNPISQYTIAKDCINIIVNKDNEIDNLTSEQVKRIFTGKVTSWSQIKAQ